MTIALVTVPQTASPQQVDLWIGYTLPANPDLAANARLIEAGARRQRSASLAICGNAQNVGPCERDAERTFRGHLLAAAGLAYGLYAGESDSLPWVINLPSELVTAGDWDQFFDRLEPDRVNHLGIKIDLRACRFLRASDNHPARQPEALFAQTVCMLIKRGQNATDMLYTVWEPSNPPPVHLVQMLLDLGADPNAALGRIKDSPNSFLIGPPLLVRAIESGNASVIRLLIERGADVNTYDTSGGAVTGVTALGTAARLGRTDVVRLLLESGASVNKADERHLGPLDYAVQADEFVTAQLLIRAGANPNGLSDGYTPLMYAASRGRIDIARLLLDAGADVNATRFKETALALAVKAGKGQVALLLRERGGR